MEPKSRLDRFLAYVPRVLASHTHILILMVLGVYLIVLPLAGVNVAPSRSLLAVTIQTSLPISVRASPRGTLTLLAHASSGVNRLAEATHKIMADLYRERTGHEHPAVMLGGERR